MNDHHDRLIPILILIAFILCGVVTVFVGYYFVIGIAALVTWLLNLMC
jgi:uncharacterized membrane protein